MVTNAELNDNTIMEMVGGNALRLLRYVDRFNKAELLLSKKQARRALVLEMHKAGMTVRQISSALKVGNRVISDIIARRGKFSDAFINALNVSGSYIGMYQKTDDFSQKFILDMKRAERLMIIELVKAGFTDIQITAALNVAIDRVKRIRKKLQKEEV